jgi:hypothetical protein
MTLARLTSYGSESWTVKTNERQLIPTEMCFFRSVRYTLWDHRRNGDIVKELQIPQVTEFIGRAIAEAVSCRLPTTAAWVEAQVRSCGICVLKKW